MALELTDAINACLRGIGQAPVTFEDDVNLDAAIARDTILQVSRDIQSRGWWFNEEGNWKLTPDFNGEIKIPNNAIDVVSWASSREAELSIRGDSIYDAVSHSKDLRHLVDDNNQIVFIFTLEIPFIDLPPVAQYAVIYRARRMFAQDVEGDAQRWKFTNYDEERADIQLQAAQLRNKKTNYLTYNSVAQDFLANAGGENSRASRTVIGRSAMVNRGLV